MDYQSILFSKDGGVGRITLNRPQALNALTNQVRYEICMALEECGDDPDIRVAVVKGEGRAFCSGDDLRGASEPAPPSQRRGVGDMVLAFRDCPKPVIGQVHGYAFGAGLEMLLGMDVIIAAEGTQFCQPFVKRAMGWGGTFLPRFIGMRRATEMLFTGEPIGSDQALDWGLVTRVVPQDGLEAEVEKWAQLLGSSATVALSGIKANLTEGWTVGLREGYRFTDSQLARSSLAADAAEGRLAFRERREPNFTGR